MSALRKTILASLAILAVLAAVTIGFRGGDRTTAQTRSATVLPEPVLLPDFQLTDQDGSVFTRASLLHRDTLLFFGFTHCPDICPATLQQLAVVRRRLAADRPDVGRLPDILLISVDPERDTAAILKEYTGHFGSGVGAASGRPDELKKLTAALGIFFAKDETTGTDYGMSHSAAVLLINDGAEFEAVFNAPIDIDAMVADLRILLGPA
jgi:protein SCO1/2